MTRATYQITRDKKALYGFLSANDVETDARNAVAAFAGSSEGFVTIENIKDVEHGIEATIVLHDKADLVGLQELWFKVLRDFGVDATFLRKGN